MGSKFLKVGLASILIIAVLLLMLFPINFTVDKSQPKYFITVGDPVEASGVTSDYTGTTSTSVQQALNALPATGGVIQLISPAYTFTTTVSRAINNVTIQGMNSTTITYAGACFSVGLQTGWVFKDFSTAIGGTITNYTSALIQNVSIGTDHIEYQIPNTSTAADFVVPVGRTATYVVAASGAPAHVKAQADFVCDGVNDEATIQLAMDYAPLSARQIILSPGYYEIAAPIEFSHNDVEIVGQVGNKYPVLRMVTGANTTFFRNTSGTAVWGCGLRNMYLDGQLANNLVSGTGINIDNLWSFRVDRVMCADFRTYGIYSASIATEGADLQNIEIARCGVGLLLGSQNLARLHNIYAASCGTSMVFGTLSRVTGDQLYSDSATGNGITFNGVVNCDFQCVSFDSAGSSNFILYHANNYSTFNLRSISYTLTKPSNSHINISLNNSETVTGMTLNLKASGTSIVYGLNFAGGGTSGTMQRSSITGDIMDVAGSKALLWNGFTEIDNTWSLKGYIHTGELKTASGSLVPTGTCTATTVSGTFTESPLALKPGANTMTCTASGTINVVMPAGSTAVVTSGDSTVTGSPKTCPAGATTLVTVATGAGADTFTITVHCNAFAWHNPEAQDILIKKIVINRSVAGGTATAKMNVGIADNGTVDDPGAEFFENLLANNAAAIHDSYVAGGTSYGTQTIWVNCQDSVSATGGWVVGKLDTEIANALAGTYYIEYVGK